MCGTQNEARDIEQGFALGHKNVHFLRQGACKWQHSPKQKKTQQDSKMQSTPKLKALKQWSQGNRQARIHIASCKAGKVFFLVNPIGTFVRRTCKL
jgi:hypothetical protein